MRLRAQFVITNLSMAWGARPVKYIFSHIIRAQNVKQEISERHPFRDEKKNYKHKSRSSLVVIFNV